MACDEQDNCLPCQDTCPEETCPEKNYTDVNCTDTFPFKCGIWTGEDVECFGLVNGDSGDIVISKMAAAICDSVVNSPDNLFRISSADTTSNYFEDKIVAGTGIIFTKLNTGGDEQIRISLDTDYANTPLVINSSDNTIVAVLSGTADHTADLTVAVSGDSGNIIAVHADGLYAISDHKVAVTVNDTTPSFLLSKLVAGTNISIALQNSGGNESIQISSTAGGLAQVYTEDSDTIYFSGNGTSGNPISAYVIISPTSGNALVSDSGLYVDTNGWIKNQIIAPQTTANAWVDGQLIAGTPFAGNTGESIIAADLIRISGLAGSALIISGGATTTFEGGAHVMLQDTTNSQASMIQLSTSGNLDVWVYDGTWSVATRFFTNKDVIFYGAITSTHSFRSSDKRKKEEILDNPYIPEIVNIKPKMYKKAGKIEFGYYAQDVEPILPHAISKGQDGFLSLSYEEVFVMKIAALEKEIEELKKKLK
jgi:hypothetical protein